MSGPVLLVVGAVDDHAAADLCEKFDVLCGYRHARCVVIDVRAALADDRLETLVAQLRRRAQRLGMDVVVRGAVRSPAVGTAQGTGP